MTAIPVGVSTPPDLERLYDNACRQYLVASAWYFRQPDENRRNAERLTAWRLKYRVETYGVQRP
jgi:hypothetical protein